MNHLELDETEERMFEHTATGYGAVITGGTPEQREESLRELIDGPHTVIDGRKIESSDDFENAVVLQTGYRDEEELERLLIGPVDVRRALGEAGTNLLILEFDSMPSDTQTSVAQLMKAVAESSEFTESIGYTCEEGDAVVKAEFDLSSRVKTWEIE